MSEPSGNTGRLEEIIDREMDRHPHSQPLLEAFRPLFLARNRLLEDLELGEDVPFKIDEIRFQGGVPVIEQHPLLQENDPGDDLVRAIIPALQEGFPDLRGDLENFEKALSEGKVVLSEYFLRNRDGQENLLSAWAEILSIAAPRIGFVLNSAARVVLEKRAKDIAEQIQGLKWEKGYCPVCGSFPSLAVIGEKIGERWLHCSNCGHLWRFSRVICPYCEHEEQEGMDFFLIEDNPQEAAFACDSCQRYLVTLYRVSDLNDRNLDVSALGLTHLDVIMQEKNLFPMAVTDWNVL